MFHYNNAVAFSKLSIWVCELNCDGYLRLTKEVPLALTYGKYCK